MEKKKNYSHTHCEQQEIMDSEGLSLQSHEQA